MKNNTRNFTCTKPVSINIPDTSSLSWQFSQRSDMQLRIFCQMMMRVKQGYNAFFVTLTYSKKYRNYFKYTTTWYDGFNDCETQTTISCPCFSRDDIHYFVRGIQKDLLRKFNVSDIDYCIASEYGKTGEYSPHYHCLFFIPKTYTLKSGESGSINSQKVHSLFKKWWSVPTGTFDARGVPERELRGWILPRTPLGGYDKKGHYHNPIKIDTDKIENCVKSSIYVSKYCCKQIGFYDNEKVKYVYNSILENSDSDAMKRFRRVKPFIKTSLHFGECINDIVLNGSVDWLPQINSSDPCENLFNGVHTPLKPIDDFCSIPSYNKRKLIYDYELVSKEEEVRYPHNFLGRRNSTVFDDDDFFNLKDIYDFDDSQIEESYIKYKYDRKLNDFGKKYVEFEFNKKVENTELDFCDFRNAVMYGKDFKDFISMYPCLYPSKTDSCDNAGLIVSNFQRDFLNIDMHALSVYKHAYRDRLNPLHFALWLAKPDLFNDYYVENEKGEYNLFWLYDSEKVKPFRTLKYYDVDKYDNRNTMRVLSKSDVDFYLDELLSDDDETYFAYTKFYGDEDISCLVSRSLEFVLSDVDLVSSPQNSDFCPNNIPSSVFFNNFPCFANFDSILLVIESYKSFVTERSLQSTANKENRKKISKDMIYSADNV